MNIKELQERIMAITSEMTQIKANYSKLEGHFEECNHWLATLIKAEEMAKIKEEVPNGATNNESPQGNPEE